MKTKPLRANSSPFMNKVLSKVVMTRSRLLNKYLKFPTKEKEKNYKKQRNYCTGLLKNENKTFYGNIDISNITDNKSFWQTVKPFFQKNTSVGKKVTLVEDEEIGSKDNELAETMKVYFSRILKSSDQRIAIKTKHISKYEDHPSIIKTKEIVNVNECFPFTTVEDNISEKIKGLNKNKGFFYAFSCPGTMTTHAESINSDLQCGLDRHLRQITTMNIEQYQLDITATLVVKY